MYVLTQDGTIVRVPNGTGMPDSPVSLGSSFAGAFLDFDPGACQFIVGPGASGSYERLNQQLGGVSVIPGTSTVGGQGGAVDRFRPTVFGKIDILIANPI